MVGIVIVETGLEEVGMGIGGGLDFVQCSA